MIRTLHPRPLSARGGGGGGGGAGSPRMFRVVSRARRPVGVAREREGKDVW